VDEREHRSTRSSHVSRSFARCIASVHSTIITPDRLSARERERERKRERRTKSSVIGAISGHRPRYPAMNMRTRNALRRYSERSRRQSLVSPQHCPSTTPRAARAGERSAREVVAVSGHASTSPIDHRAIESGSMQSRRNARERDERFVDRD